MIQWAVRSRGDKMDSGPAGEWEAWFTRFEDAELYGMNKYGEYFEIAATTDDPEDADSTRRLN